MRKSLRVISVVFALLLIATAGMAQTFQYDLNNFHGTNGASDLTSFGSGHLSGGFYLGDPGGGLDLLLPSHYLGGVGNNFTLTLGGVGFQGLTDQEVITSNDYGYFDQLLPLPHGGWELSGVPFNPALPSTLVYKWVGDATGATVALSLNGVIGDIFHVYLEPQNGDEITFFEFFGDVGATQHKLDYITLDYEAASVVPESNSYILLLAGCIPCAAFLLRRRSTRP